MNILHLGLREGHSHLNSGYRILAGDFITNLYASVENCEVDPRKCLASELANNQKHLKETCEVVVQKIVNVHG